MNIIDKFKDDKNQNEKIKKFFSTLGINTKGKLFFHQMMYKGIKIFSCSQNTIRDFFSKYNGKQEYRRRESWFLVNQGTKATKTIALKTGQERTKVYERKYKADINQVNAFYFDVDLKDEAGNHYNGDELESAKSGLLKQLDLLPLKPSAIIESRNGYHIYYAIIDAEKTMDQKTWTKTELMMYNYIYYNVTNRIDPQVTDINRVLRIPGSLHKKADCDEYWRIGVLEVNDLHYSSQELQGAFWHELTNLQEKKVVAKNTGRMSVGLMSAQVTAIKDLDTTYFHDRMALPQKHLSYKDTMEWIRQFPMFDLLGIVGGVENQNFSSVIYADNSPSCVIFQGRNNKWYYHNNAYNDTYDNISLVSLIAGVDTATAVTFLADILNVAITADIAEIPQLSVDVDNQLDTCRDTFRTLVSKYEFLKKYGDIYMTILGIVADNAKRMRIADAYACQTMITTDYLLNIMKTLGYKTSTKKINRQMQFLVLIGILKKVTDEKEVIGKVTKNYGVLANHYHLIKLDDNTELIDDLDYWISKRGKNGSIKGINNDYIINELGNKWDIRIHGHSYENTDWEKIIKK